MARKALQLAKGLFVPGTKWVLLSEIARGGMGVTWEVVKHPGIKGVMKMILPDLAASESYVRRFLEEVAILTKLNHPNIVQVFDFDTLDDGTPFFVMEKLQGKTLGEAMVETSPDGRRVKRAFPARIAYEITRQICEALHRAHSLQPRGVIHRDLKPENIFIHHPEGSGEPIIKLLDFGVAAFEQAVREAGPVGTPRYMAPEQLRCEDITCKADLYAMGLVLYEMLVGRGPFDHLTSGVDPKNRALVLLNAHLNEPPPPPSQFAPWITKNIDSLLLSSLDKDPAKRPVSAYALSIKLYDLQHVDDGTPRAAVDVNTTMPTLMTLAGGALADSQAGGEPPRSPPAPSLPPNHDTVPQAPPVFGRGQTVRMPIDPFEQTAPKAGPAVQGRVDRGAHTKLAADPLPRRRVPQYDTDPMSSREEPRRGREERGGRAVVPSKPEATPLTSEMPSRSAESLRRSARERAGEPADRRAWWDWDVRKPSWPLLTLFALLPAVGFALVFAFKRVGTLTALPTQELPAAAVVAAADESAPLPSAACASPVANKADPASTPPSPVAAAAPAPLAAVAPSASASAEATTSTARPKSPLPRPAGGRAAIPRAIASGADDGRDLLYVPPRQP